MEISKYEMYFSTPISFSELMQKFSQAGYPAEYDLVREEDGDQAIKLTWMVGNGMMHATLKGKGKWKNRNKYELCVGDKEAFMKLHDIIMSLGLCVSGYEVHIKTDKNTRPMDIKNKIENAGYRVVMDLGKKGIEMHIMNGSNGYMNIMMKLYMEDEDYKWYEMCVNNKNDFMQMHDILSRIMM